MLTCVEHIQVNIYGTYMFQLCSPTPPGSGWLVGGNKLDQICKSTIKRDFQFIITSITFFFFDFLTTAWFSV